MSSKIYKSSGWDKYDCHRPSTKNFMHDDYFVSMHQSQFHTTYCYGYIGESRGFPMGVNKKLHKVSSCGYIVNGNHVGKSDAE